MGVLPHLNGILLGNLEDSALAATHIQEGQGLGAQPSVQALAKSERGLRMMQCMIEHRRGCNNAVGRCARGRGGHVSGSSAHVEGSNSHRGRESREPEHVSVGALKRSTRNLRWDQR